MRAMPVVAVLLLSAAVADARPKKKAQATGKAGPAAPACGAKVLPLVPGAQWTYNPVPAPVPAPEAIMRIAPPQPKQIVITVKSVDTKGTDTVVSLEEKLQIERKDPAKDETKIEERTLSTTITCNGKDKFDISPDSFFFAGEPGGAVDLDITKVERIKGTSLALVKGGIGTAQWGEDLTMQWAEKPNEKSSAKLPSGKLEMERRFTPQEPEAITTKMGQYTAEKILLQTTGRVTLDNAQPNAKPSELPANWYSTLWLADGVGVVQALNSYGHMYQLVDSGNAADRAAPADGAAPAAPADAAAPKTPAKGGKKKKGK